MRKIALLVSILLLLVLSACSDEPTPEPTAVPEAAEPTEAPATEPAAEPTEAQTAEPTPEPESTAVPEEAEPTEAPAEEPTAEQPAPEEQMEINPEIIDCPDHVDLSQTSDDEVEGETYECGVVVVPENYDNPDGRTIELVYTRLFSSSDNPDPVPVLYLSGGPGGSALHEVLHPRLFPNMQFIRENRDIVFYDQRGTGLSAPINCSPVHAAIGAAIELLPDLSEVIESLEGSPISLYYNMVICAQGYTAAGIDLSQYNSVASAHDMASLMTALGYDQYVPYGTSYGTKLAQVAMRETPDRIPSAVLDGTSPVSQPQQANSLIEFNEQYVRIFEQCAADPECNEAYPNLADRFTGLLNNLLAEPIPIEDPIVPSSTMRTVMNAVGLGGVQSFNEIDVQLFQTIVQYNNKIANHDEGAPKSILNRIPRAILAAEEGDVEYFRELIGGDPAAAEEVDEVEEELLTAFPDEQFVEPWNEYVAPTLQAILAEAETAAR